MYLKPELLPIEGTQLTGHTTAWYDLPNKRFREKELAPRKIWATYAGSVFNEVKMEAIKSLKRQRKNCFALQITICFRTMYGVEAKVSYLAKRGKL